MLTTTLIATTLLAQAGTAPLACPVMGKPVNERSKAFEFAGFRMRICCPGCDAPIKRDPNKIFADAAKSNRVIAEALFDMVDGIRLDAKMAKGALDHKGVRYYFISKDNMETFKKNPAIYTAIPKKELMTCPISGEAIPAVSKAGYFRDFGGVRYYICCGGCLPKFDANPSEVTLKWVEKATDVVVR